MEEKAQQIAAIKKQIGDAEIEPAIKQLLAFLEKTPAYLNLHSDALQALAQFRKTKREEAQGLISYDQGRISYNQVVNQVLNILEQLEQEDKAATPGRRFRRPILIGSAAGLTLLVVAVFLLGRPWGKALELTSEEVCSKFSADSAAFNILLLPYQNIQTTEIGRNDAIPVQLRQRFRDFAAQSGLMLDPELLPEDDPVRDNPELLAPDQAKIEELGKSCPALRLVIWGTSESAGGTNRLTTRYQFTNLKNGGLQMTQLALNGTEVNEVTFISSIATSSQVTGEIEKVIQLLSGILAHESGQNALALSQLTALETSDSSLRFVRDVMLADTYLRTNQKDLAAQTYDTLTQEHPQYWVAWYNRGLLNLEQGKNEEAAADLSTMLHLDSTKIDARMARAEAYLRLDQFARAKTDLEIAQKTAPADTTIQKKLDQIKAAIDKEQLIRDRADQKLTRNPGDRIALREKVQADIKLGNTESAIETAKTWVKRQPKNPDAYKALFQAFRDAGQLEEARELLRRAVERGILPKETAARWQAILQRDTSLLRLRTISLMKKQ